MPAMGERYFCRGTGVCYTLLSPYYGGDWVASDGGNQGDSIIWSYELMDNPANEFVLIKIEDDKHLLQLRLKYSK
jgi:hypothetical protein